MALSADTLTPETVKKYYDQLRALPEGVLPEESGDPLPAVPARWTDADCNIAAEFAKRVAKATTLQEFEDFCRTGELIVPIKITPAEMEVLMGGGPFGNWVGAVGAIGMAASGAAACSNN